jgi:hypothetical protein
MAWKRFSSDQRGVAMLEFAVVAPLFFALFLGIMETGLAFYWWKSTEKAAQLGARMAIVRDAASEDLPATNVLASGATLGQPCRLDPSPCEDFGIVECTGAGCTGAGFDMIIDRMRSVFPPIEPENVTVRYAYVGLGYAGGPAVPAVSVTVSGVEFPFFMLGQIFALFANDASAPTTIPDIRATLTGEDLST